MTDDLSRPVRRSLLFVPGAEPKKLEKAGAAGADTVIFDLEDAVAPDAKNLARKLVAGALEAQAHGDAEPAVRINAPGTAYYAEDLAAAVEAGARAIVLPKAESAHAIAEVARRIDALEKDLGHPERSVKILALIESARGIAGVSGLADAASRLDALAFGHADFALDMGLGEADASGGVVLHARCTLAIAAKAAGVAPLDCVYLAVKDEAGFREDAALGLRLGFEGKLCLHPAQVRLANQVYTPTASEIEHARRVVEAWERAAAEGRGVITLDGKMIDAPVVRLLQRLLERAMRAGALG